MGVVERIEHGLPGQAHAQRQGIDEHAQRAISAFAGQLDGLQVDGNYRTYDSVTADQRQQIADKAKALAAALDGIDPALGLTGLK